MLAMNRTIMFFCTILDMFLQVASNLLKKGLPLCIEVLGQSRNEPKSPPEVPLNERSVKSKFENEMETVLIEKWVLLFRPTTDR